MLNHKRLILAATAISLVSLTMIACKGSAENDDSSKSKRRDDVNRSDNPKGDDREPRGSVGLRARNNDEVVVKLAKKIISDCEMVMSRWDEKTCPDYASWSEGDIFEAGAHDVTLVNLVEDPEPKVRGLAATALSRRGVQYRNEAELASRVTSALKRERNEAVARDMASAVSRIQLEKVSLTDDVLSLAADHPLEEVRHRLTQGLLRPNGETEKVYLFVRNAAERHQEPKMRINALEAFGMNPIRGRDADLCAMLRRVSTTDANGEVAATAVKVALQKNHDDCGAEYDAVLSHVEKLAKGGEVSSSDIPLGLRTLSKRKDIDDQLRQRTLAAAEAILANPANDGRARGWALRVIGESDPEGAVIAGKYASDTSRHVKEMAADIAAGKVKVKER